MYGHLLLDREGDFLFSVSLAETKSQIHPRGLLMLAYLFSVFLFCFVLFWVPTPTPLLPYAAFNYISNFKSFLERGRPRLTRISFPWHQLSSPSHEATMAHLLNAVLGEWYWAIQAAASGGCSLKPMMALEMFSYCQSGSGQDAFRLQIGTRTCTKTTEENINAFHMSAMSGWCVPVFWWHLKPVLPWQLALSEY